tara:strand:- start:9 stop:710 length:702 start_codon:yes stop_codon:yes gene_type:complete
MIKAGSIRESNLSKQFEFKHKKIQKADEGAQLLVSEDNTASPDHKRFKPVTIHGDGTLDGTGKLTVNFPESKTVVQGDGLTEDQKRKLDGIEDGATRDKTGVELKDAYEANADTNAFTDANKNQLDSTHSTYVASTSNHTAGSSSAISTSNGGIAGTSQTIPLTMITASSTGNNSNTTDYIVEHGLGNVPLDVKVFEGNEEVETEVVSTTTTSTIKFSKPDVTFTTKIFGLKS